MLNNNLPFVSILIPIRNEVRHIPRCLQAVAEQDYPSDLIEVLVADGMSDDGTFELLQDWVVQTANRYVFQNPGKIVPTGLNILIPKAKGNVIIRVDGHCLIAPDYVRQCVVALTTSGAENVGGRMTAIGSNAFGMAVAAATSVPFGIGNARFHYSDKEEFVDTVYLGAWPIYVFKNIGLFDEELVRDQDDEFNYRLRSSGGRILLSPKINSCYTVRSKPLTLWKQYFQYGFWKVRVLQKHPRQMSVRQFVPLVFVLALILTLLLSLLVSWGWLALLILLATYLVANLAASIITASGQGLKKLLLLPPAFAIIHLSYGLGFLVGLFKFWTRWRDTKGHVPPLDWES